MQGRELCSGLTSRENQSFEEQMDTLTLHVDVHNHRIKAQIPCLRGWLYSQLNPQHPALIVERLTINKQM